MFASRLHWRLLIGTIAILMAAAWLTPLVAPSPDLLENRYLAAKPVWPHRFAELKAFRLASDAYVADHFPTRPHLIAVLNRLRLFVGVSGSSSVIIGRHGWLFLDDGTHLGPARGEPPPSTEQVRDWLTTLDGRTEWVRAHGAHYVVVVPPVKEVIYPEYAPAWFHPNPERPPILLTRLARETGSGDILYLSPDIAQATARGLTTYSLHDTHWNGNGAYVGYAGLMNHLHALGLTEGPRPLADFPKAGRPKIHWPRDLARLLGVASFVDFNFPHYGPADRAKVKTTYLTSARNWEAPLVIETGQVGKPVLMMSRDSFSVELLPFLYSHFSRIVLAHNKDGCWRPDLIERFKPGIVILEAVEWHFAEALAAGGPRQDPPPSPEAKARIALALARFAPEPAQPAPPRPAVAQ